MPIHVAKTMTYPEKVCPANLALMQQLVRNGCDVHPGANFIKVGPPLLEVLDLIKAMQYLKIIM